jgi:hypothetical protein
MSSNIRQQRRWSYRTLSGKLPIPLGFSIPRLLIDEGAASGGDQGLLTRCGHGQGLGCAPSCVGGLWPPSGSLSVFGTLPGKIRILELISSNSENISCVAFLKHKTAENRELALWHLVSRLVP